MLQRRKKLRNNLYILLKAIKWLNEFLFFVVKHERLRDFSMYWINYNVFVRMSGLLKRLNAADDVGISSHPLQSFQIMINSFILMNLFIFCAT